MSGTRWNTCRFCHLSSVEPGGSKSAVVRYGIRHYAHLACLQAKGKLDEALRGMTTWALGQLPAFELKDLGKMEFVRDLITVAEHREADGKCGRNWWLRDGCACAACRAERERAA